MASFSIYIGRARGQQLVLIFYSPFDKQLALALHVVPLADDLVEVLLHGGRLEGDACGDNNIYVYFVNYL